MSHEPDKAVVAPDVPQAPGDVAARLLSWPQVWGLMLLLAVACAVAAAMYHATELFFPPILTLIICILAAFYDAATARIPNEITYTAILVGLTINILPPLLVGAAQARWLGATGATEALCGFLLCAGIGLGSLLIAGMGGGDMKLLAALGALLGFSDCIPVLVVALVVAIIYALLNLIVAGRLNQAMGGLSVQVLELVYLQRTSPMAPLTKRTIPLAVPLVLGLLVARLGVTLKFPFWPFIG